MTDATDNWREATEELNATFDQLNEYYHTAVVHDDKEKPLANFKNYVKYGWMGEV